MLKKLLNAIFGSQNERDIKDIMPIVDKINALEPSVKRLSDDELKNKTVEFRERLSKGETLDDILPEAFACVREASIRTIGLRHFDVQLIGGVILHQGKIAEMRTGEGKTLVATLAAYLNALPAKGVHIVTVNDYLAKRDKEWMGVVYEKLGLTVGNVLHDIAHEEKVAAYNCDITYVTNNEIGFDYLRDNMVIDKSARVLRPLNYAIIDEVDSILIDEARTPLIISGATDEKTDKYYISDRIVPMLKGKKITESEEIQAKYDGVDLSKGYDYLVDEKHHSVVLTEQGVLKAEKILGIKNIYDDLQSEWVHHITQAIKAHELFRRDVEYVIKDGEVMIVDEFTGRLMPGRRWSDGLHQAVEAKENVKIANENQTLATITFQNFFRMYNKISGMTGTASTESAEFWEIYKLGVVEIPTNNAMIRADNADVIYRTEKEKDNAIVNEIDQSWRKGQPVLVGTRSIEKSEKLSSMLRKKGIPHQVLNAKYHELEANIIANAGTKSAVTIATNMAGRGTDIVLGAKDEAQNKEVKELGGLHIIGTERHESRRIDNQLRGRAGRQGDPGSSKFFLSMEDELMRLFGSDRMSSIMQRLGIKEGEDIQHPWISRAVEGAQKKVEGMNFDIRKQLIDYDNVMNKQREAIYRIRNQVLEGEDVTVTIEEMLDESVEEKIEMWACEKYAEQWDWTSIEAWLLRTFGIKYELANKDEINYLTPEALKEDVMQKVLEAYEKRKQELAGEPEIQRMILLHMIDSSWRDHLYELDHLKHAIGFRAYAQKDPKIEYQKESYALFESMMKRIRENTVEYIFKVQVVARPQPVFNVGSENAGDVTKNNPASVSRKETKKVTAADLNKIGRNDPCPCGSGKKYKKCCGQ
ncbi:preprotein translocase subunit SecA [Endomicrobium proavitum]|uniref:Protein translocase subunit SecA n=1 Tax=Endomicrobium proavitum TaxID=1408281 RepID=A0A0G3WFU4_9BACT|nr:preprotein translocase subunit SecA [Endomicrobium proavitum]AKL97481.1 preprotein translocase subunit, ATPase [Endomicrobium proavitum]